MRPNCNRIINNGSNSKSELINNATSKRCRIDTVHRNNAIDTFSVCALLFHRAVRWIADALADTIRLIAHANSVLLWNHETKCWLYWRLVCSFANWENDPPAQHILWYDIGWCRNLPCRSSNAAPKESSCPPNYAIRCGFATECCMNPHSAQDLQWSQMQILSEGDIPAAHRRLHRTNLARKPSLYAETHKYVCIPPTQARSWTWHDAKSSCISNSFSSFETNHIHEHGHFLMVSVNTYLHVNKLFDEMHFEAKAQFPHFAKFCTSKIFAMSMLRSKRPPLQTKLKNWVYSSRYHTFALLAQNRVLNQVRKVLALLESDAHYS